MAISLYGHAGGNNCQISGTRVISSTFDPDNSSTLLFGVGAGSQTALTSMTWQGTEMTMINSWASVRYILNPALTSGSFNTYFAGDYAGGESIIGVSGTDLINPVKQYTYLGVSNGQNFYTTLYNCTVGNIIMSFSNWNWGSNCSEFFGSWYNSTIEIRRDGNGGGCAASSGGGDPFCMRTAFGYKVVASSTETVGNTTTSNLWGGIYLVELQVPVVASQQITWLM